MNINLSLDVKEYDEYCIDTYQDNICDCVGIHYIFRFENGYGASVVKSFASEGYNKDLWELAVILFEDEKKLGTDEYILVYPKQIVSDEHVLGYLTDKDVKNILEKIRNL